MNSLFHDLRYALRSALRAPGFTLVAVAALALGIGANTAIFSVVHAVMLNPLPYRDPGRLVVVWEETARRPGRPNVVAPANFLRWKDRATAFERLAAFYDFRTNLSGGGDPEELVAQAVTPDFFPALGVSPMLGRAFAPDEGSERNSGHDRFTILSYDLWQRRFGGDKAILGGTIQLGGNPVTVVGVMPPGVRLFLKAGSLVGKPPDLWLPLQFREEARQPRGRYLSAIARLKPGVSLGEAQAQMDTIARGLAVEWREFDTGWTVQLVPMNAELAGELKPALLVLMGAVAFVLLIACANVANLLLARGAARRREIAIRTALGAGRWRLVRQLLTESLALAALGGLAGVVLAQWAVDLLLAISPVDRATLGEVGLNYPVLAFAAALSILTAVVCGLVPALEGAQSDVHAGLKEGAREAGVGRRSRRLRQAFVVSEVALALVLLVGAGLLIRSFANLRGISPGFQAQGVLTARIALPMLKYEDDARRTRFFRDAVERMSAIPGVRAAGVISFPPFTGLGAATGFTIEGQAPPAPGQVPVLDVRVCDNGYFHAMGIPLLRGRLFSAREVQETSNVVIINESLARHYFPNENPLGRRLLIQMMDPVIPTTIVGVVGDVRHADLQTEPRAMSYWPHPQLPYSAMTLTIAASADPSALAPRVQHEVQSLDREQPLSDVRTMDEWIGRSLARTRFSWMVLAVFAGMALLLASIGIYGVVSYSVGQQTAEIGVRLALGAARRDILVMVIAGAMRLAALGLGAGLVLALLLSRALTALLYGTRGTDPATLAGAVVVLAGVAMLAAYLPARRAARIEPVQALRDQ
jgi:putative ABC transport system permease protein